MTFDEETGHTGTSPAMVRAAADLADRIERIDWTIVWDEDGHNPVASRVRLLREHLRRAAVWCTELEPFLPGGIGRKWYFKDLALLVAPGIRAEQTVLDQFRESWGGKGGFRMTACLYYSLHWAALAASGDPRHDRLAQKLGPDADPYEPLMRFFERGGGFDLMGSGEIDIDFLASFRPGPTEDVLAHEPLYDLSQENLDRIDGFRWVAPGPSQPLVS